MTLPFPAYFASSITARQTKDYRKFLLDYFLF